MYANFDIIYIASALVAILISMVIHEMTHAYVSYWLGDDTARLHGRLSLNPIKHIDPILSILLPLTLAIANAPIFGGAKPVPFNPNNIKGGEWGVALVAVSGPLSNLVLAFVSFVALLFIGSSAGSVIEQFLALAMYVNIGFFVFNLIPIPPLDGSRVLYAVAPDYAKKIMVSMESYGLIIIFALILVAQGWLANLIITMQGAIIDLFKIITMVN